MVQALMTDPKLEAPKPHGYCEKCSTASETVCHFYPDMCPDRAAIEPSPEPTTETQFWQSVRELAKLRYSIPAERRSISGAPSLSDESPTPGGSDDE